MQATQTRDYTPEEYLAIEEFSEYKSEYINGKIIPMAGGTINHNKLAGNLYASLNFAFKQQDYQVFIGDVRLWIPEKRIFTYPDVMIIAGEPEYVNNRTDIIANPVVIIEVLSKSTQAYDHEGKFNAYRTIPTFQEYLLVDQTRIHVEQSYITSKKQGWFREYDDEDEAIALTAVPFQITLDDLYSKVKFEPVTEEVKGEEVLKEDETWIQTDLSSLGSHEPYDWQPGELEEGLPVKYVSGKGLIVDK